MAVSILFLSTALFTYAEEPLTVNARYDSSTGNAVISGVLSAGAGKSVFIRITGPSDYFYLFEVIAGKDGLYQHVYRVNGKAEGLYRVEASNGESDALAKKSFTYASNTHPSPSPTPTASPSPAPTVSPSAMPERPQSTSTVPPVSSSPVITTAVSDAGLVMEASVMPAVSEKILENGQKKIAAVAEFGNEALASMYRNIDLLVSEKSKEGMSGRKTVLVLKSDIPPEAAGKVDDSTVLFPSELVTYALGKINEMIIDTGMATVALPPSAFLTDKALAELADKKSAPVSVSVSLMDREAILSQLVKDNGMRPEEAEEAARVIMASAGGAQIYDFNAAVGAAKITGFNLKPNEYVEVALPYSPKPGENPENITVFRIDNNGSLQNEAGIYDAETGKVTIKVKHFSRFVIKDNTQAFSDLAGHAWAAKHIEALAAKGIINGTGKGKYAPGDKLTRAQFAVLMVRCLKIGDSSYRAGFKDVAESDWFYNDLCKAVEAGLIRGRTDGSFGPGEYITREDMSVIIARVLEKFYGKEAPENSKEILEKYSDGNAVAEYARNSAAFVTAYKVLEGVSENTFAPKNPATRAEAAVVTYRMLYLR